MGIIKAAIFSATITEVLPEVEALCAAEVVDRSVLDGETEAVDDSAATLQHSKCIVNLLLVQHSAIFVIDIRLEIKYGTKSGIFVAVKNSIIGTKTKLSKMS